MLNALRHAAARWIAPRAQGPETILRAIAAQTGGVSEASALGVAAFNRCVELISGAVGSLPVDIVERAGPRVRIERDDHPVAELLARRPNEHQTPSEFKRLVQTHVLLRGNAYAMKVSSRGRLAALLPMDPDRTEVEQREDGRLVYRYRTRRGETIVLDRRDVFHVRALSLDGVRGISVLERARGALRFAQATQQHGTALFENKAAVSSAFKHPATMTDAAYKRLKDSLEDYRGPENTGKSLILEEGMELTQIQMTSTDAQWLESRKDNRIEIYMAFGVPPHLAGDTEKTTSFGSGVEQQSIAFVQYTLGSHLKAFEEAVERDLLDRPEDARLRAKFNVNALLRGDIKARYQAYAIGRQWGWLSPNDIRALEEMNPRADGRGDDYAEPPNAPGGTTETDDEPKDAAGDS